MRRLWQILERVGEVMPPMEVYNEGNLLAPLVLDALDRREGEHSLAPMPGARWYREALLASPFAPRLRGDLLGEGWTHADGAVGHFAIGGGRGDLRLKPDAGQLVIVKAKLGSPLSSGTTRAPAYDQAARDVACLANAISASPVERAGFCVLAPRASIDLGTFGDLVTVESVTKRVAEGIASYQGERDAWQAEVFCPALPRIDLGVLSWEEVLGSIGLGRRLEPARQSARRVEVPESAEDVGGAESRPLAVAPASESALLVGSPPEQNAATGRRSAGAARLRELRPPLSEFQRSSPRSRSPWSERSRGAPRRPWGLGRARGESTRLSTAGHCCRFQRACASAPTPLSSLGR